MDARARRIAENESRFREINERLQADLRKLPIDGDPVEFVCECGQLECAASVELTLDEYEHARRDPATFALLPGHEIPDVEDVVEREDHYILVRKREPGATVAQAADPRSQM